MPILFTYICIEFWDKIWNLNFVKFNMNPKETAGREKAKSNVTNW